MDFSSIALVAVPIALSALAFVAYNHPAQYVYLQLGIIALLLLAFMGAAGYAFGAMFTRNDIVTALQSIPNHCQSTALKAVDTVSVPPFNEVNLFLLLAIAIVSFFGYLPKLGITRDQK